MWDTDDKIYVFDHSLGNLIVYKFGDKEIYYLTINQNVETIEDIIECMLKSPNKKEGDIININSEQNIKLYFDNVAHFGKYCVHLQYVTKNI